MNIEVTSVIYNIQLTVHENELYSLLEWFNSLTFDQKSNTSAVIWRLIEVAQQRLKQ